MGEEPLVTIFIGTAICALLFLLWMKFTPWGKKWLDNL